MPPLTFRVVNLRHEPADLRVCRPSRWGNPWKIVRNGRSGFAVERVERRHGVRQYSTHIELTRQEAHAFAVRQYRSWITERPELVTALLLHLNDMGATRGWTYRDYPPEITLGCWCAPLPCHATVLIEQLKKIIPP